MPASKFLGQTWRGIPADKKEREVMTVGDGIKRYIHDNMGRRSGLDRRLKETSNFSPERRSGEDRRKATVDRRKHLLGRIHPFEEMQS